MTHFYKNVREAQLKVGLFVVACLIILFFSYSWLNDWFVGNKYDNYTVLFDSVSSLEKGGSVFFRGMRVGRINNLKITNDGVIVDVLVETGIRIDDNATFVIKDKDMMGTKALDIMPGNGTARLQTGKVYTGTSMPGFSELISNVNTLMDQVSVLMKSLESEGELFKRLDNLLTNTDKTLLQAQDLMTQLQRSDMTAAFTELKKTSQTLNRLINENEPLLIETVVVAKNTMAKVDSLIVTTDKLFKQLEPKEGSSVDKLLKDEELYKSIISSLKELEALIEDIKKTPHKYFKFSIF